MEKEAEFNSSPGTEPWAVSLDPSLKWAGFALQLPKQLIK